MKILAAIMDVVHVKIFGKKGRFSYPSKIKKYFVYDPRKVTPLEIEDARAKQIR